MTQTGSASVWGVDGLITIASVARAAFPESVEGEQRAVIEEFLDGFGELIGFRKRDVREYVDLVLVPKKTAATGSLNDALKALVYPSGPVKVSLSNLPDTDTAGGHSANEIGHNGDYIYLTGAKRTMIRGQGALRLTVFRSLTSPFSVDQLCTVAA